MKLTAERLKQKHKLTSKQSRYVENRVLKGMTQTQSIIQAGYSPSSPAAKIEESPAVRNAMHDAMMRAGIGLDYLARKMKDGLTAKDYRFFTKDGVVTDERVLPDHAVREKFLKTALEVAGFIKNHSDVNVNLGVIGIPVGGAADEAGWNDPAKAKTECQNEGDLPSI